MSDLGELRQRVDAAASQFKRINELQHGRWDRLRDLVQKLEQDLHGLRESEASAKREIDRLSDENVELRSMVSTLLRFTEDDSLTESLGEIETKVSRLERIVGNAPEPAEEPANPVKKTPPPSKPATAEAAAVEPPRKAGSGPVPAAESSPTSGGGSERPNETEAEYEQLVVRQISKLARALNEAKNGRKEAAQGDRENSGSPQDKAAG